ncbi:hypothetical protein G6045_09170 [Streptomyces sp. YC504]|uniref:Lipoprotein n=1 Tax=Streptomyces mesophilus TaxID=1775132 RepID=A0A6G4XG68_9ACTN|nr:hypothetical protein [Streptomyces mesophilus]NGO75840.1 hypothetical protein [Streptomyces mesophilus]
MKKSKLSQVVVAAAVVATLGLTAACSGDSGSDGGDKSGKDKSSAGQSGGGEEKAAPALTEAQLKQAIIGDTEVKGLKFSAEGTDEAAPESEEMSGECQPLGDVLSENTDPKPKANTAKAGMDGQMSQLAYVALSAHEQADAEKVLGEVREASKNCKGFTDSEGVKSTVEALADPQAGDEAVAYKIGGKVEGQTVSMVVNVVRSSSTLAVFYGMNMADGSKSEIPQGLLDLQIKKIEAVK